MQVTIDGIKVEVEDGVTILEAANKAGVDIPTLCHDPRLHLYGACRMCLVQVEGAPRLIASCSTPANDGMKVTTENETINRLRGTIIEVLSIKHPLDCPVCDSAGACDFQDMVHKYLTWDVRIKDERHAKPADSRAPLVERNSNRCIVCAKCVRICEEVQGVGAIGLVNRSHETEVQPSYGEPLDCEFCGQCISTCPVGALLSKPFKYQSRPWLLTKKPSTCGYCGVGCSINLEKEHNLVKRITSTIGTGVNNGNLCGKGRFGYQVFQHKDRLKQPLRRDPKSGELKKIEWKTAYAEAANNFQKIIDNHGAGAIAAIGSPRCTNEDNYLLQKFIRSTVPSGKIGSVAAYGQNLWQEALKECCGVNQAAHPLTLLDQSDLNLVFESELSDFSPVMALKLFYNPRHKDGCNLITVNSRVTKLNKFSSLAPLINPGATLPLVKALIKLLIDKKMCDLSQAKKISNFEELKKSVKDFTPKQIEKDTGISAETVEQIADQIGAAQMPVLAISKGISENTKSADTLKAVLNLAMVAGAVTNGLPNVIFAREFCNVQGALDMGVSGSHLPGYSTDPKPFIDKWETEVAPLIENFDAEQIIEGIINGEIKALYIMGENPLVNFPDRERVEKALDSLEFLLVQDALLTDTVNKAHLVFPAAMWAEKNGTFTNMEHRLQRITAAVKSPGEAKLDWLIIKELSDKMGNHFSYQSADEVMLEIAEMANGYSIDLGQVFRAEVPELKFASMDNAPLKEKTHARYPLFLVGGNLLHHSGTMSTANPALMEVEGENIVLLNPQDAEKYQLVEGENVNVTSRKNAVKAKVELDDKINSGIVFMPGHFSQGSVNSLLKLEDGLPLIPTVRLEKVL